MVGTVVEMVNEFLGIVRVCSTWNSDDENCRVFVYYRAGWVEDVVLETRAKDMFGDWCEWTMHVVNKGDEHWRLGDLVNGLAAWDATVTLYSLRHMRLFDLEEKEKQKRLAGIWRRQEEVE